MVKSKTTELPIAQLVEDLELYPRHAVDASNVRSLALALEAGSVLPPIVADKNSLRITDGWHRCRAYRRVYGDTATVPVELVDYHNELAMVADAVSRNANHGRRLDVMDQTRAALMLESRGADKIQIAAALHVPEERVEKLRIRIAQSKTDTRATIPGTHKIALKRSLRHFNGTKMTAEQARAHDMMPGTPLTLIARQLRTAIEQDLLDLKNERLMSELELLQAALNGLLLKA